MAREEPADYSLDARRAIGKRPMSMFGHIIARAGSWWIHSDIDPRWNASGRDIVGSGYAGDDAYAKLKELDEKLGARPKDLKIGYMKD